MTTLLTKNTRFKGNKFTLILCNFKYLIRSDTGTVPMSVIRQFSLRGPVIISFLSKKEKRITYKQVTEEDNARPRHYAITLHTPVHDSQLTDGCVDVSLENLCLVELLVPMSCNPYFSKRALLGQDNLGVEHRLIRTD